MSTRLVAIIVSAVAMIAALALTAQGGEDMGFKVWVADPLVKVLPEAPVPEKADKAISVDAVRNEYESAQVIVSAQADIGNLSVRISDLSGPSRVTPRIQANFLGFVPVKHGTSDTPPEELVAKPPAEIPDILLASKSVSVKAGRNQPIWLTIYVSKRTPPGTYTGKVVIEADSQAVEVPVSVRVHPVVMPDERTLYLTNWLSIGNIANAHGMELWSEPFWKMLGAYARCMADHRQSVVITPIFELITAREDGSGKLTFDFSLFDRWVELFKEAGIIGTIEGSHLGGRSEWEAPDFDAFMMKTTAPDGSLKTNPKVTVTSDEERRFLSQFLPALQKHLEDKGWVDIYLQHLCDEPITQNAESYKKLSSMVREFAPKLKIIDASMCTEIAGSIDIWVPQPPEFEQKQAFFKERKKAGDEVWFYTCLAPKDKYMNRFVDYPLIKTRLLHWANYKYDLPGYLHWGLNFWSSDPFNCVESDWGGGTYLPPGDSHIVYPGKRGPMSSIRFEALRDGVEDYELLKMLEKQNPKKARSMCNSVVRSWTDYTRDPAEFRAARLKLIKALE